MEAPCEKLDLKQVCHLTPSCLFVLDIFMLFALFTPFCRSSAPNTVYWGFLAFIFLIYFSRYPFFCSSLYLFLSRCFFLIFVCLLCTTQLISLVCHTGHILTEKAYALCWAYYHSITKCLHMFIACIISACL